MSSGSSGIPHLIQKGRWQGQERSRAVWHTPLIGRAPALFTRNGELTAGQCHDAPQALPLLAGLAPAYLIADRGYDSDPLVATLAARGIHAVIPPRRTRRTPRPYDAERYTHRHSVERLFSRLKQFRRVATRYDKHDQHFLAFVYLAATMLWLRDC